MQVYEWYFVYLTPISVYFGTFWSLEVVRKIERALICPELVSAAYVNAFEGTCGKQGSTYPTVKYSYLGRHPTIFEGT